jgi:hypothetical protein
MPVPTGLIIAGLPVKRDGGVIATPPGNVFATTRFDEANEIFGRGPDALTTPKSGTNITPIYPTGVYLNVGDVIAKVSVDLAGSGNTVMRTMDKGNIIPATKQLDSGTTRQVATAIRNNQWNQYSGVFSTPPLTGTSLYGVDFSTIASGGITSTAGNKFRFMTGSKNPSGVTYKGPTVW